MRVSWAWSNYQSDEGELKKREAKTKEERARCMSYVVSLLAGRHKQELFHLLYRIVSTITGSCDGGYRCKMKRIVELFKNFEDE